MLSSIEPPILTLLVGVISFSMVTNHKQTCVIHFVDCRKALHSYFTHHTRKYFGCERRRGLHGGRHVVARVDVLGTTCAAGGSLGLASGKLPSAHIASYEKGRCCQALSCGETVLYRDLSLNTCFAGNINCSGIPYEANSGEICEI